METGITVDPEVCGGKPCIRGPRIRVVDVLELLASGASHEEILEDYPDFEDADILAVLRCVLSGWPSKCSAPQQASSFSSLTSCSSKRSRLAFTPSPTP